MLLDRNHLWKQLLSIKWREVQTTCGLLVFCSGVLRKFQEKFLHHMYVFVFCVFDIYIKPQFQLFCYSQWSKSAKHFFIILSLLLTPCYSSKSKTSWRIVITQFPTGMESISFSSAVNLLVVCSEMFSCTQLDYHQGKTDNYLRNCMFIILYVLLT